MSGTATKVRKCYCLKKISKVAPSCDQTFQFSFFFLLKRKENKTKGKKMKILQFTKKLALYENTMSEAHLLHLK